MPTWVILLIVVAVIVLMAAGVAGRMARTRRVRRTRELRARFGPEYDRLAYGGSRRQVERELLKRERRHQGLDLKPLSEPDRVKYAAGWQDAQLFFLDDPVQAVRDAEALIGKVMAKRGYPSTVDLAAQADELSVEHARQLSNLRAAQAITAAAGSGKATTEDLRQAMVRYRALFADLLRAATSEAPSYPDDPEEAVRVIPSSTDG
ncbi:MAG: hypothetical protein QOD91_2650 [Frankiales bacterium]|nr:hypothetical protein [Frankiales bacterium]